VELTPELLTRIGMGLWGQHFKRPLASALSVRLDTVGRWCNGRESIPDGVHAELRDLVQDRRGTLNNLLIELKTGAAHVLSFGEFTFGALNGEIWEIEFLEFGQVADLRFSVNHRLTAKFMKQKFPTAAAMLLAGAGLDGWWTIEDARVRPDNMVQAILYRAEPKDA